MDAARKSIDFRLGLVYKCIFLYVCWKLYTHYISVDVSVRIINKLEYIYISIVNCTCAFSRTKIVVGIGL